MQEVSEKIMYRLKEKAMAMSTCLRVSAEILDKVSPGTNIELTV